VEEGPATHSRVCDSSMGREIECRAQCLFAGVWLVCSGGVLLRSCRDVVASC
jgi:hypothetical protein